MAKMQENSIHDMAKCIAFVNKDHMPKNVLFHYYTYTNKSMWKNIEKLPWHDRQIPTICNIKIAMEHTKKFAM